MCQIATIVRPHSCRKEHSLFDTHLLSHLKVQINRTSLAIVFVGTYFFDSLVRCLSLACFNLVIEILRINPFIEKLRVGIVFPINETDKHKKSRQN
jgi:hypothetical protein